MRSHQLSGLLTLLKNNISQTTTSFSYITHQSLIHQINESTIDALDAVSDNPLQTMYGDIKKSGDYYYIAYNDTFDDHSIPTIKLSDHMQGIATSSSNRPIQPPEGYDTIILSHITQSIIEGKYSELQVIDSKAHYSTISNLQNKLSKFGVKTSLVPYESQKTTDQSAAPRQLPHIPYAFGPVYAPESQTTLSVLEKS